MQKGDKLLDSQIEKSKQQILKACSETFNMEEITNSLLTTQAKGLREKLKELQKSMDLGKIGEAEYVKNKRGIIVELQDSGVKLTNEETEWLEQHDFDVNKGEVKKETEAKHMAVAQKNISQLNNK